MTGKKENFLNCRLCGNSFKKETYACPGGCLLGPTCGLVCCPRCHYQFVEESKTVNFLKKIFARQKRAKEGDHE